MIQFLYFFFSILASESSMKPVPNPNKQIGFFEFWTEYKEHDEATIGKVMSDRHFLHLFCFFDVIKLR